MVHHYRFVHMQSIQMNCVNACLCVFYLPLYIFSLHPGFSSYYTYIFRFTLIRHTCQTISIVSTKLLTKRFSTHDDSSNVIFGFPFCHFSQFMNSIHKIFFHFAATAVVAVFCLHCYHLIVFYSIFHSKLKLYIVSICPISICRHA